MPDHDIEQWVTEELHWDPKVDGNAISVSVEDGNVTLRGTVGSFREKREAESAARRVYGVKALNNDLQVRLLTEHGRGDADLRGSVLRALHLNSLLPQTIDARVDDGWVTLTGTAAWQYQRDEADFVAGNIAGVLGVDDEIDLTKTEPSIGDIEKAIRMAFERSASIDAENVSVDSYDGTVVLTGSVSSPAGHDEALAAAWAAPGVTKVDDYIELDY